MTSSDPSLPVPEDDALDAAASAVVDGVATPEEAALVAASPDGSDRVAALRAVADAIGVPVRPQDPAAAAGALTAALAGFDAPPAEDASTRPLLEHTRVDSLPPVPAAARGRGLPRLATVAAALLLLVGVGVFSVAVLTADDDDTTGFSASPPAPQAAEQRDAGDPGTTSAPAPPASDAPGPLANTAPSSVPPASAPPTRNEAATAAPSSPPPVVDGGDLGGQDEVEAVALRVAAALDGVADPGVAPPGAALPRDVQACATAGARSGEPAGALRYRAVGTYQGTPAVFLVYDRPGDPPRLLLILARTGCAILDSTHF